MTGQGFHFLAADHADDFVFAEGFFQGNRGRGGFRFGRSRFYHRGLAFFQGAEGLVQFNQFGNQFFFSHGSR